MTDETEEQEIQESPVQEEAKNEVVEAQPETPKVDKADQNWKEVHQVLKMQKQKIDELENRLQTQSKPQAVPEKDEFDELDPEDYVSVQQARKMAETLAEKKAAQAAQKYVQEYAQSQRVVSDETRCRTKYEDYDYIIENFALPMIKNDPALAYKIQNSRNPAETAYKLAKISDEYEGANMKEQPTSPKAEKILKNTSRPTSSNAVGSNLKSQADQFSKMSKNEIWEQAQKYAKGA